MGWFRSGGEWGKGGVWEAWMGAKEPKETDNGGRDTLHTETRYTQREAQQKKDEGGDERGSPLSLKGTVGSPDINQKTVCISTDF